MRAYFILIAVSSSFLAGCSAGGLSIVTQNDVDAARSAYDAAFLAPAVAYRELPQCGSSLSSGAACAQVAVVQKLQAADKLVEQGFDYVQQTLSSADASNTATEFSRLTNAIAAAASALSSIGAR